MDIRRLHQLKAMGATSVQIAEILGLDSASQVRRLLYQTKDLVEASYLDSDGFSLNLRPLDKEKAKSPENEDTEASDDVKNSGPKLA